VHLVPGCPARILLPLLVLFYNMFEGINNQSINQSIILTLSVTCVYVRS